MSSPLTPRVRGAYQAFTLIELLTVIAIIGVLAGITFGVVTGVQSRSAVSRARTELAVLAQALEAYKAQYGDYPRVEITDTNVTDFQIPSSPQVQDRAYHLFRALMGRSGPTRDLIQREISPGSFRDKYGKAFIEPSKFRLERKERGDSPSGNEPLPDPAVNTLNDPDFVNAVIDPWGNRYIYSYKSRTNPGAWRNSSYILMSAGPDGYIKWPAGGVPSDGIFPDAFYTDVEASGPSAGKGNVDNIYSNR